MPYRHELRVRYAECDMQGVVFNAHYLGYADDALSFWMTTFPTPMEDLGYDLMVVRAEVDWRGSARFNDLVVVDCAVVRWGTTSLVIGYDMTVEGRSVCRVELTYVGVKASTTDPMPPPDEVRRALEAPAA
jgi:acyl-CoA thioester hydrolase